MRVALSIQAGKISSVTLLRRLSTYSRRNNFYKAFREVGRVIRTVQLLRYLSDPQLRRRTTSATNKVESYNSPVPSRDLTQDQPMAPNEIYRAYLGPTP